MYGMRNDRSRLLKLFKSIFSGEGGLTFPMDTETEGLVTIDPFTFFATFNRGVSPEKRNRIVRLALDGLGRQDVATPTDYEGLPVVNNMRSWFFGGKQDRGAHDIDNLWELFCAAMELATNPAGVQQRLQMAHAFDAVRSQICIKWNITIGLFWVLPNIYMPLDAHSRGYLADVLGIKVKGANLPAGEEYLVIMDAIRAATDKPFYELSADAYEWKPEPKTPWGWHPNLKEYNPGIDQDTWDQLLDDSSIFNPQAQAFLRRMMDAGGKATCTQLAQTYGESMSYYQSAGTNMAMKVAKALDCPLWQGKYWPILFYGKNTSKDDAGLFLWMIRPELAEALKSRDLSDVPLYAEPDGEAASQTSAKKPYDDAQFLQDVFVSKSDLTAMKGLLERKKNLILQGAPGTGKTYAARRLAYAMMGEEDDSRIGFVQFHQSYTYEDFVIGYRPNGEGGFDIQPGIFADFCARAARDSERSYFFIIDEINRANISKVFGELLMLIEADHRGDSIELSIDRRRLTVPKNLFIIGMMNTADRGLALIDYALRRRFAFFDMKPALDAPGFLTMLQNTGNEKLGALVDAVREINKEIEKDPALGQGFCIGHSYFCMQQGVTDEDVHGIARFEIEPLIAEYWFDDQQKVRKLTDKLESVFNA
ncbi:AAA family ATPase [Enorma massiliensis]|uniref:AAA family ATPase n=1 Tax=Enorma massiliensis TaxID=1472761 RepID=UPI00320A02F9